MTLLAFFLACAAWVVFPRTCSLVCRGAAFVVAWLIGLILLIVGFVLSFVGAAAFHAGETFSDLSAALLRKP